MPQRKNIGGSPRCAPFGHGGIGSIGLWQFWPCHDWGGLLGLIEESRRGSAGLRRGYIVFLQGSHGVAVEFGA